MLINVFPDLNKFVPLEEEVAFDDVLESGGRAIDLLQDPELQVALHHLLVIFTRLRVS